MKDIRIEVVGEDEKEICLTVHMGDLRIPVMLPYVPPGALRRDLVNQAVREAVARKEFAELQAIHARTRMRLDELASAAARSQTAATPPVIAQLMLSFLAPKNCGQAFLGDLQEMFQKNAERFGEKEARRKYWMQVASSIAPLTWQYLRRIGVVTVLIDYFRSKFGLF